MAPPTNLAALDLNLLVALDALLLERHVTRAGKRIGLSQPAMSYALSRLRELFDDPLFTRGRDGMLPTPRAEALAPRVRRLLEEIRATLLYTDTFTPGADARRFVIASNDYCGHVLLPPLVEAVRAEAPNVEFRFRRPGVGFPETALADGDLDLALGTYPEVPDAFHQVELFHERFVCVVRRDHPVIGGRLTLDQYTNTDHVLIASPSEGRGVVDMALEKLDRARRVAVYVPDFLVAPAIVSRTDLVLTLASMIAEAVKQTYRLRVVEPPIELPTFAVSMVWHERTDRDPGCRWLRDTLFAVTAPYRAPAEAGSAGDADETSGEEDTPA